MNEINSVSQYFNDNWNKYQITVNKNTLYHSEMVLTLMNFLSETFNDKSFSLVDIGCGDASTITPVLSHFSASKYIGVDAAPEILDLAQKHLQSINCDKEFICMGMMDAIIKIKPPVDIIYTSYALHHLSYHEKAEFIKKCHALLNDNGYLIMVDGILKEAESRNEWLTKLRDRFIKTQGLSEEEVIDRMEHPTSSDFPEEIMTFEKMSDEQGWSKFEVILEKDICAFMTFRK